MGETGNMLKIFQEERVKEALERLSQNYELEGLVVANKEGILLYSYPCKNYSEECVAVLGGILFSVGLLIPHDIEKHQLQKVVLHYPDKKIVYSHITEDLILGLIVNMKPAKENIEKVDEIVNQVKEIVLKNTT